MLKIRTPSGTRITRANTSAAVCELQNCIYDHTGCAAWRQGPCCVEVAARLRRTVKLKAGRLARPKLAATPESGRAALAALSG